MRRVRPILQATQSECGLACAAMVLNAYGHRVLVPDLRKVAPVGRDGLTLRRLKDLLQSFGCEVHVYRFHADTSLRNIRRPAIVLWNNNHYVVIKRVSRRRVTIIDPAYGTLSLSREKFRSHSSGIMLIAIPKAGHPKVRRHGHADHRLFVGPLWANKGMILTVAVATVLGILLGLVPPALSAFVMDQYFPNPEVADLRVVAVFLLLLVSCYALNFLARALSSVVLERSLDYEISSSVFRHLFRLPFAYFFGRPSGDLLLRFSSIANIRDAITSRVFPLALNLVSVTCYLFVVFSVSFSYGLTLVALVLLLLLSVMSFVGIGRRLSDEEIQARSKTQSFIIDALNGVENMKAMGLEDLAISNYESALTREVFASLKRNYVDSILNAFVTAIGFVSPLVLLLVGFFEFSHGSLTLGSVVGLTSLSGAALSPVASMAADFNVILMTRVHVGRLIDILGEKTEDLAIASKRRPELQFDSIRFEDVSFRFAGSDCNVISDASFTINRGDNVVVAGETGAGKSTIGRILCMLLLPTEGRVFVDGIDVREIDSVTYRSRIGVVVQGAPASQGTIESNLRMGDDSIPEGDLWEALSVAELANDIKSMPLGLSTPLGEGGVGLSGGQAQRLVLARALVRKPALILLDEATANIDPATEHKILGNLSNLAVTWIMITHRRRTILEASKVLYIKEGSVAGFSDPKSLQSMSSEFRSFMSLG